MGIDIAHYHGWEGKLRSPWWGSLAIVRVAMLQVFRRKSYWVVIGLGGLIFILYWALIYIMTQFDMGPRTQTDVYRIFGFSPVPTEDMDNGYVIFMQRESIAVMILLAFSGSLLVGTDFRMGSLTFYLSRRIDRVQYIVGKLLAVSTVVAMMTVLPALVLYVEYGLFTSSTAYWRQNWQLPIAVLSYGAVLCAVLSIWLVTLAAYLQRMAPIAITWSSLFVMCGQMSKFLRESSDNRNWDLLDPWRCMRLVGKLCFGTFQYPGEYARSWWAVLILATTCTLALAALMRRVRAVEVVT
jgi:ABC-type transport system involved in multi-copper enzyme maturation permease subunit